MDIKEPYTALLKHVKQILKRIFNYLQMEARQKCRAAAKRIAVMVLRHDHDEVVHAGQSQHGQPNFALPGSCDTRYPAFVY